MHFIKNLFGFIWTNLGRLRRFLNGLLLFLFFSAFLVLLIPIKYDVKDRSILLINLKGELVEQLQGDPFERAADEFFGEIRNETLVQDVIDTLEYAKTDKRISLIILRLDEFTYGGLSKLERIANMIDSLRDNDKEIIAFAESYNRSSYYLAARTNKVLLHPDGYITPEGFSFYSNYYSDLIDKIKVEFNIFRVGSFKSAIEPFVRNNMSDESRETRLRLAKEFWYKYENDIVASRKLNDNGLTKYSKDLMKEIEGTEKNIATIALSNNIVDELITKNQLLNNLKKEYQLDDDEIEERMISMNNYLSALKSENAEQERENNVGIIIASGQILDGNQPPGLIGSDSLISIIKEAQKDESVKALVLRIDSPGGSAFASEEILEQLIEFKSTEKPLIISIGSVAASGGYWIAMAGDKIFASDVSITGSIGIFAMLPTIHNTLAEIGIYNDGVTSNDINTDFYIDRELSPDLKKIIQSQIEHGYRTFVNKVAIHRDMKPSQVENIAEGQVWTGKEALNNGLIDQIGGLDEAVLEAASLAKIDSLNYGIKLIEDDFSGTRLFSKSIIETLSAFGFNYQYSKIEKNPIHKIDSFIQKRISLLMRFNDPKGIYAYCFCEDF